MQIFGRALDVASPVNILQGRYVIGQGCKPHECCAHEALFVLDTVQKKGWALRSNNSPECRPGAATAEMWGTLLGPDDMVPRREIERWLGQNKISWWKVSSATPSQLSQPTPRVTPPSCSTTQSPVVAPPPVPAQRSGPGLLPDAETGPVRIQMVRDGGTYAVPVQINGTLTLNFVVDSGASDVSIPSDVFGTLIRSGTVTSGDIIGKARYTLPTAP